MRLARRKSTTELVPRNKNPVSLRSLPIFVQNLSAMLSKNAISLGIYFAILLIVIFLVQAIFDGGLVLSLIMGTVSLAATIAFPVIFVRKERLENGGSISFGAAFKTAFIGMLIGGALSTAFNYLYVEFVDPSYPERTVENTIKSQQRFMEGNVSHEQMEETMRVTEDGIRKGFTFTGMVSSFLYYALFFLVLSLIFAAFLKKDPPPSAVIEEEDYENGTSPLN